LFIAALLCLFFLGCGVKAPQQEVESGSVAVSVKVEKEEKDENASEDFDHHPGLSLFILSFGDSRPVAP
jgi:hypothetical protein